ncbi:protein inturned isoform X2 [Tachysurus fulvidraco]|uniref:protein inturned isoform X2 n=1 Tax=Tachysurus fulvidraco TaxID=1234273 RepID=UPI001FEFD2EB|nr:protein inturned isoform X2 [Tachysurus fulvidraco]
MAYRELGERIQTNSASNLNEDSDGSDTQSCSSSYSEYSDELEPEWIDDVQKNGELFYLELSEGEEEALLSQITTAQSTATNHVRFSEKEAEIITDKRSKKRTGSSTKSQPKFKKLAKILRGKRHPSQRSKADGKNGRASQPPTSILKNQTGQRTGLVVQQPFLKDVCVYVNPKRLGCISPPPSEKGGLLEALLGVVLQGGDGLACNGERLVIHGLVPHSPASKCAQILIGDVLVAVDDVDVTSENIERVLSCISGPTQVHLTLETGSGSGSVMDSEVPRPRPAAPVSQLVRLLWGEDTTELQMTVAHIPHIVMYLSLKLDSESLQEEQEILYQYPVSEAAAQLKAVRGIFLTLCDMLENFTGGQIVNSSLVLRKQLVHVGYWKEGEKLLVIGLPADRVPLLHLQTVIKRLVRTLRVLYGSLHSAFSELENAPRLDHFFCLFFQRMIQPSRLSDSPGSSPSNISGNLFLDNLPAMRWLTLPPDIKVEVDTVLSEFESSDFGDMSEDFYGMRRLYVILGSCLFYKGYLIANHLPKEDLLDVCLYCQHYCLLCLGAEQRVGQLVVWREVFLQRRSQPDSGSSTSTSTSTSSSHPGYCESNGRVFLLVVGLKHFMQCVLLEAGGCASLALGSPGPDCIYVDQVKATLLQLECLESPIEERLSAPPTPCLSCADWFLPSSGRDRQDMIGSSPILSRLTAAIKPPSPGTIGRSLFRESGSGLKGRKPSPQRSVSDSGSEGRSEQGDTGLRMTPAGTRRDSLGSGGSDGSGGSGGLFKIPKLKQPNPFYLGSLKKSLTEREAEEMQNTLKLTAGLENTLFHYVLMETVQGIFITPTHRELSQLSGSIHPQLIRNFHHCCLSIRNVFQQSLPPGDRRGADRSHSSGGLGPVKEHGILFQCKPENWTDQKKPAPTMTYWVIGRMMLEPVPQEFYVCFHDSVPEIPVEMAFRLSFGLAV